MSARVRSVLLGLGLGVAPILLLDLARTLRASVQADPTATSFWWVVACYVITGAISAVSSAAPAVIHRYSGCTTQVSG